MALASAIALTGLVWYFVLWAVSFLGCFTARQRYRRRLQSTLSTTSKEAAPGVSILRPLKGLDTNLYQNLESTFNQRYPNFELILSVADESDAALPVARALMAKYPAVDCRINIGEQVVGVNPKVNNLMRPYRDAKHDILWVLDSNVVVAPDTLAHSVDALLQPGIALVHHVPFAVLTDTQYLGSRVETAFLNTNHAKMYLAINAAAIDSCVMGKSNLYRRSDLERINGSRKPIPEGGHNGLCGFEAFGRYMAEDNMIASALWHELGARHDLSCDVARNFVGDMTLRDYIWRRIRWIRVRKHMVLSATLAEPFTECVVLSVMGAINLKYLFDVSPWLTLLLHYMVWIYVDLDVYASVNGTPLPADQRLSFMFAWAIRELLTLPIFVYAVFGSEVVWRGRRYKMLPNGEVESAGR
ncbi:Glycosyltransferase family 21 protein [Mycena kentingensis (nom. inval.)]|nr:Glycosyltransferase family 21 protein [Mycena kentingensis (nom. inval.)]